MIKQLFVAGMLMASLVTVKSYAQEKPQEPKQHQKGEFFKKIDTDGDGKLSKGEVGAAAKDDKRAAKLLDNFDAIDTNKDGFIDKDELKTFKKSQPRPKKDGGRK